MRQFQNRVALLKFITFTFFCTLSAGPYVVLENYANWKTLSFNSKSAYITGLWDGYLVFFGDDIIKEYNAICSEGALVKVADLVDIIDSLYEKEINRKFSPASLLKDYGLKHLCNNQN